MDYSELCVDSDAETQHECPRCKEPRYTSQFEFKDNEGNRSKICNKCRDKSKEVKNEKKELETKKCSRCYKIKNCNEFTSPRKVCNTCLDDKKEYRRCKREGIERVKEEKEPPKRDRTIMYNCPLCQCLVKLYKKAQHEKTKTHQRNIQQQSQET